MSDYTLAPTDKQLEETHPLDSSESTGAVPIVRSATLRSVVRLGTGARRWTTLCILGSTAAAAVLAILHHLFDTHLNGRVVSGFWSETKTTQLEILLANAFKIVFCFSAGVSLCQVAWHSMRREALSSGISKWLISIAFIARNHQCHSGFTTHYSFCTFPHYPPSSRTLTVPTLNLLTDAMLDDIVLNTDNYAGASGTWDQVVLAGMTSKNPRGWTIPQGCAPECRYNITYFAPALRCSDLTSDQIDDRAGPTGSGRIVPRTFQDPPAAWFAGYDLTLVGALSTGLVNFTAVGSRSQPAAASSKFTWTLAYLPFAASNADAGALIKAAGTACTFYNATHNAQTHFANGTQESSVSVVKFLEPLDTKQRYVHVFNEGGINNSNPYVGTPGVNFAPGLGSGLHYFAFADAMAARLLGVVQCEYHGTVSATDTLRFTGLNSSTSITNISQALENLVANMTLSFVHRGTGFTDVDAVVDSTLGAAYLSAFACLVAVNALGMACLVRNGEPASNSFTHLLIATRNVRLDAVADTVQADERSAASIRLMFGQVGVPGRGVRAAFDLTSGQRGG
ncbi:hypothetical protein C8R47DRAFT_1316820 [Mycena vitilis]|nr:hypothetical protein C8R47DRAFT_1316820 [Mycena vitilis]